VYEDLEDVEMTWEETEEDAKDRKIWISCVARCAEATYIAEGLRSEHFELQWRSFVAYSAF